MNGGKWGNKSYPFRRRERVKDRDGVFRLQHFPTRDRSGKDLGKYVARLITSRKERHQGLFGFLSFRLLLEFLVQLVRRRSG